MDAAERAIDAERSDDRFRENEEQNFVNVGAIFTANGNVRVTLVVRGTSAADAVCNRMTFIRDHMVVLFSDYPSAKDKLAAGPRGYPGSLVGGINQIVEDEVIARIRFDPYHLGQLGGSASC